MWNLIAVYRKDEIFNLAESGLILILRANIKNKIKYKRKKLGKYDYICTQQT